MNAATKTRAAKSVPPTKAPTAETLLCQVRADLRIVERKLITAHNAAEAGSTLDTLLEHVAYQLLPSAVNGLLGDNPTKDDAERAYVALFVPIALLECLLLSADGTILEGTIRDAFETLDRIDNQLDSSGEISRSLPDLEPPPPAGPTPATDTEGPEPLEEALAHYAHALAVVKLLGHDQQHSDLVPAAYNLMLHDYDAFMESFGCGVDALNDVSADLSVVLGLLSAAAHDLSDGEDSCIWGAHTLAEMSKRVLDEHIRDIEFGGAST